jgi:ABC-2 type transport system ATP-binding protein
MDAQEQYSIETVNLTKQFDERVAVDNINLRIKKGELFALLGPNAAGKTTTINMLCCLLKPSSGTATINGYDINHQQYKIKEFIGVSPQETAISERLNTYENLSLIGKINGVKGNELKERIQLLIKTMGLNERAKDQVRKLSGGMKRRLSIMMALINDPEVLFLDEPTLGLDPQSRRTLWDYIMQLKGQKTVILTTHYMDEADFLADNIGIIDKGKIVAFGTSSQLKEGIAEKHCMVIDTQNINENAVREIGIRYEEVSVSKNTITVTDTQIDVKEIVDLLYSYKVIVRSAYFKEPTLEDVFLDITGRRLRE